MKVVFLKDVAGVARRNDVKDVADGHALNMLIPRGLAEIATPKALARVADTKARDEAHKKAEESALAAALEALKDKTVSISEKANEKGHLFSGVTAAHVSAAIKSTLGIDLAASLLDIPKPIKETGIHTIKIVGKASHAASIKIEIKAIGNKG